MDPEMASLAGDLFEDETTAKLVQQILAMPVGERLPSEREQAETLGVSRTLLRDRLRHLEAVGILERRVGSGTFVREVTTETVTQSLALGLLASQLTIESLASVRVALEREAAVQACTSRDHVNLARMLVAVERMEATDDADELFAADVAFHTALFDASNSPALTFFRDALWVLLSHTLHHLGVGDNRTMMRQVHRGIYECIAVSNVPETMAAVTLHFEWMAKIAEGARRTAS
jgi:GntR family transcriptional repressor for pyruvate dehydrogenase complex